MFQMVLLSVSKFSNGMIISGMIISGMNNGRSKTCVFNMSICSPLLLLNHEECKEKASKYQSETKISAQGNSCE